jgi:hypothetical protein
MIASYFFSRKVTPEADSLWRTAKTPRKERHKNLKKSNAYCKSFQKQHQRKLCGFAS